MNDYDYDYDYDYIGDDSLHSYDGKVIASIEQSEYGNYERNDAIIIKFTDGSTFIAAHSQSCCERVNISEIDGDLRSLVGAQIESITEDTDLNRDEKTDRQTQTTWINIHTTNGTVRVTFDGSSNGYYGTGVSFWGNICT